ncbi:hypothetical protein ACFY4C_14330 [Actinomadura viridis]|uniref:hypothetical protein n=1 Tax=Actinomadura viridis TaxID=58110 RepID=UPI003676C9E7
MSNLPPWSGQSVPPAGPPGFPPPPPGGAAPPPPPQGPETYEHSTELPVVYLPVMSGERHIGYLWASVDDQAAGFLRRKEFLEEFFESIFVWIDRLQEAHQQGLPAREAIRQWAGRPEDPVGGGVPAGAEERVAAGSQEVTRLADPDYEPSPWESLTRGGDFAAAPVDSAENEEPAGSEPPASYALDTDGPIRYLPVVKGDVVLGYVWASVEGDAAMYLPREDAGMDGANAANAWIPRLRTLCQTGVAAQDALTRLKAMPEDPRGGAIAVGSSPQDLPSLRDLERLAATYEQSLRVSFIPRQDDVEVYRRPALQGEERDAVLRYLREAPLVYDSGNPLEDGFDPDRPARVPGTFQTDGTWVWLGGVTYHLEVHGIPPEPDLVEHIRANGFQVPEVGDAALAEAKRTLKWKGILVPPPGMDG